MLEGSETEATARVSLTTRLLLAASVVLVAFLGIAGFVLESAYRDGARQLIQDRMQAQVYALLSATEVDDQGNVSLPEGPPDPQLARPDSGIYAAISTHGGNVLWASPSLMGAPLQVPNEDRPGAVVFTDEMRMIAGDTRSAKLFGLAMTVDWILEDGLGRRLHVAVAQDHTEYRAQLAAFRRSMWFWFALGAGALLAAQGAVLSWSLSPLRRLTRQIRQLETGERVVLEGPQPAELQPLTDALNALVRAGQRQIARSRNALGDLAHSLKTPLAVLRAAADSDPVDRQLVNESTERMNMTVEYQLQRAAAVGRAALAGRVAVAPVVTRLLRTLAKVHHARSLMLDSQISESLRCRADEGDLTEVMGNVLDNACKWARSQVLVSATRDRLGVTIVVDDDGPGFGGIDTDALTQRGVRADSATPGHGIGLAIVRELVEDAYGGTLALSASPLGGARVQLLFPTRG